MTETLKCAVFLGLAGVLLTLAAAAGAAAEDDLPDYGRLQRRNDFFTGKSLKVVPRIGRRNDFFLKAAKSVPRIGRRSEMNTIDNGAMTAWPWFRDMDYLPRIVKKDYVMVPLHDDLDEVRSHLDLSKELDEPRLQPVV